MHMWKGGGGGDEKEIACTVEPRHPLGVKKCPNEIGVLISGVTKYITCTKAYGILSELICIHVGQCSPLEQSWR